MGGVGDKHALLVYSLIQGLPLWVPLTVVDLLIFIFMDNGISLV
jgi:hypothetical protein